MEEVRLALMGFGNVGRALAQMIVDKRAAVYSKYGKRLVVTAIATGSHGNLYKPNGIDLKQALQHYEAGGFTEDDDADWTEDSADTLVYCGEYDVLVELSPLNIRTGQPAANRIKQALKMKKSAVSANKGPLAWYYSDLAAMAKARGGKFFFESTVMDGTPIFNLRDGCLKLCEVTEIEGILNSTTNFILKALEAGKTWDQALEEGRALGMVEADPSMDTDGWDAVAKICVLSNVLMDANIHPGLVQRQGIAGITKEQIDAAKARGKVVKLMCRAKKDEFGRVTASVAPEEIGADSLYAAVDGASSVVSITTDLMGRLTIVEEDPTIIQTAYGVFQDILRTFS
ncbi:MAG: hypothetical protein J6X24_01075 [Firmicutes bacterium]|nr:hypothetical protein [Bacillota bacterium]